MSSTRVAAVLAGLWAGLLLAIALIAAPAAFATLSTPAEAGRVAGRMFSQEAPLSLALAVILFLIERRRARGLAEVGQGSQFSANLMLLLGTLFCTVAGYYAIQPMMAAARAGQGAWSFAALHGASTGFYGVKTLLVVVLAWRLAPH
ncbi:DUF4149 domain-containing protein [uncultured Piscinibacter sp.]|uniref:DUF4149 domain-containing protein n=1 Tax=uncultured Piscinibacter sp. TaxID=1131835 RepID=UPI0026363C26|nr:DUF4149 domain-containing protein [uncultured Piscinibacter sp.]